MGIEIAKCCKIILWRFVNPESRLANILKDIRDRVDTCIHPIEWQLKQASASYPVWIRMHEKAKSGKTISVLSFQPQVSFLVPKSKNWDQLPDLVQSLKAQTYPNWELIIASGRTQSADIAALDSRVKCVGEESGDYMSLATQAQGDFVVCAQVSDQFSSRFLIQCIERANQNTEAQIIYTDHDRISENGNRANPFFKPDTFSPEMLYSTNYLSRALLRRELVLSVGERLIGGVEPEVQEWEIVLNCASLSSKMIHVADVLVHQRSVSSEKAQSQTGLMLEHYLKQMGLPQPRAAQTADGWRVTWLSEQPLVSIVIPSKNNYPFFKQCVDSILELTSYKNYELVIVDNGSTDENLLAFYQELQKKGNVIIIEYNEPFNYSRAINRGAKAANGELLLFLNNDIQILNEDWLDELARWALKPEVGVVGAKLLFPDGKIQHAGVVFGLQGFVDHLYMNAPQDYCGLIGSVNWYRSVSAVTGACQMMRHAVFDELGGYDENYRLIHSDVDICLKATQKNYRIVYTPFTKVIHHQRLSRGRGDPTRDLAFGFKNLTSSFDGNDPFFSPNLTYTFIPRCQTKPESGDDRIRWMYKKQAVFERWSR